jgi:hypothetical protein
LASSFADALSPRDRRALRLGAIASAVVLAVAVGAPALRRALDREAAIAARSAELARLRGLADGGDALLAPALGARREVMAALPQRPLRAETPELAAGALQALLQQMADESQLSVVQLDAAGAADTTRAGTPALPATLVATGDVYAVADLLSRVEQGAVLLEVHECTVQALAGQRGASGQERLQVTLVLRAPVVTP